jgi:plasmid stabilization system protein ParE
VDYRVFFTDRALNDLAGIIGRIAKDDDRAGSKFGTALLDHVDLLGRFPRMGRVPESARRAENLSF